MAINGKNFMLRVKELETDTFQDLCYAESFSIRQNVDLIETAPAQSSSGRNAAYVYGKGGYEISVEGVWELSQYSLFDAQLNRKELFWSGTSDRDGGLMYSGKVLITESGLDIVPDDLVSTSSTLKGNGDITRTEIGFVRYIPARGYNGEAINYSTIYPADIFNVNGDYIGTATSESQAIIIWNNEYYNRLQGTLSASSNTAEFRLDSPYSADNIPKYIRMKQSTGEVFYLEDGQGNMVTDSYENFLVLS